MVVSILLCIVLWCRFFSGLSRVRFYGVLFSVWVCVR